MDFQALFIEAIREAADLPAPLREHASAVRDLEEHYFDQSYIEFLDTQIRLDSRGPEWTERLKRRRTALLPFCGTTLLRGRVKIDDIDFTVEINPANRTVIHWEEYDYAA